MPVVINRAETGATSSKSTTKSAVKSSGGSIDTAKRNMIAAISAGVVLVAVLAFFVIQMFGGGAGGSASPGVSVGPGQADRDEVAQSQPAAASNAVPGSASQPTRRNDDD